MMVTWTRQAAVRIVRGDQILDPFLGKIHRICSVCSVRQREKVKMTLSILA